MRFPLPSLRTSALLPSLAALPFTLASAPSALLHLDGKVRVNGAPLDGTIVVIMEQNGPAQVLRSGLAHFEHVLELQSTFLLSFERDGCVTKQLYFDTHVPAEALVRAPFDFPFLVTLEAPPKGAAFEYAGPVGYIHYHQEQGDFDYDVDYSRKVDPALLERMRERMVAINTAPLSASTTTGPSSDAPPPGGTTASRDRITVPRLSTVTSRFERPSPRRHGPLSMRFERSALSSPVAEVVDRAEPEPPIAAHVTPPALEVQRPVESGPHAADPSPGSIPQGPSTIAPAVNGRMEELRVESRRITTIIWITENGYTTEYRRVHHQFGQVYFFKNGESCSQRQYEQETRTN